MRELALDGDDLVGLHKCMSDPEVVKYFSWEPWNPEEVREFILQNTKNQQEQTYRYYDFGIIHDQFGFIGWCNVRVHHPESKEGELAYVLNRKFWGRGYASEVADALLRFGFCTLGLHRMYACCDPENRASVRVLEKMRMIREAHLRENRWRKGAYRDTLAYAILDREWLENKA